MTWGVKFWSQQLQSHWRVLAWPQQYVLKKNYVTLQLLYKGPVDEDGIWKSEPCADAKEIFWYEMSYYWMDHLYVLKRKKQKELLVENNLRLHRKKRSEILEIKEIWKQIEFSYKTERIKPQLVLVSVCSQLGDIANWIQTTVGNMF